MKVIVLVGLLLVAASALKVEGANAQETHDRGNYRPGIIDLDLNNLSEQNKRIDRALRQAFPVLKDANMASGDENITGEKNVRFYYRPTGYYETAYYNASGDKATIRFRD